jgi:hypothetical protein
VAQPLKEVDDVDGQHNQRCDMVVSLCRAGMSQAKRTELSVRMTRTPETICGLLLPVSIPWSPHTYSRA